MQKGLGGTAFEPLPERPDKELTLGPVMLVVLAGGLVTLCGVCFGFGYAVGHRSTPALLASTAAQSSGPSAAQLLTAQQSKPAAAPASSQPKPDPVTNGTTSDGTTPDGAAADSAEQSAAPAARAVVQPVSSAPASPAAAPAVIQTVLPAQSGSSPTAVAGVVRPALPQTAPASGAWMVQIAAVSHSEDADVLLGALRRKGYVVSARRDPLDNLLHVQVGPFGTHTDAANMRQKLLADGYNAIIQP